MYRLWSPWRLAYVTGAKTASGCVFCDAARPEPDSEGLVLVRGPLSFAILNLYPYNNGHLMVVPNRHTGSLVSLHDEELSDLIQLTRDAEVVLTEAYQPQGINIGVNLGQAAGAGITDHLHVHVVPRWAGDTNFMSVVGQTRVLPEDLDATAHRLRPIFERLAQHGERNPR